MHKGLKTILTIIGARPQWMKAAALSRVLSDTQWGIKERVLHTGQHYSHDMAGRFLSELDLPKADHLLNVSQDPAERMGQMMGGIMHAIEQDQPDAVILYGDTDSTLAGAWAASRCGVPVVHIEAGLRSFDRSMPEEINRILTDQLSSLLFCPSHAAVDQLTREGIVTGQRPELRVEVSGDLMLDTARHHGSEPLPLPADADAVLLTMHRPANVDDPHRLRGWIEAIGTQASKRGWRVIFPVHPRTAKNLVVAYGPDWKNADAFDSFELHAPAGYLDMLKWLGEVRQVWTDSGGLQKEAFFMHRPAVVLRDATEWVELTDLGFACLCAEPMALDACVETMEEMPPAHWDKDLYGTGKAGVAIAKTLRSWLNR